MAQRFFSDLDLQGNQLKNFSFERLASAPASPYLSYTYYDTTLNVMRQWNGSAWVNLGAAPTNGFTLKGTIVNADTLPAFPAAPAEGDAWLVVTNSGTVGTIGVEPGDMLYYIGGQWTAVQNNIGQASEAVAGYAEIATQAETQAATDDARFITPLKLRQNETDRGYARKFAGDITGNGAATTFAVTHNLGTADYTVQVRETTGNNSFIGVDTEATNANSTTVNFAVPPAPGVVYRVIVIG